MSRIQEVGTTMENKNRDHLRSMKNLKSFLKKKKNYVFI